MPSPALAAARAEGERVLRCYLPPFAGEEPTYLDVCARALRALLAALPAEGETCCTHERLNEEGICRGCGGDLRTGRPAEGIEVTVDAETGDEYAHGRCVGAPSPSVAEASVSEDEMHDATDEVACALEDFEKDESCGMDVGYSANRLREAARRLMLSALAARKGA